MKKAERILMKIVIIQFLVLLLSQMFLHSFGLLPELKGITKYEGVEGSSYSEFLETFQGR